MAGEDQTHPSGDKPIARIWAHRNFTIYMAGSVPCTITQWMQRVGVGWLTWELTESPVWLGAVAAAGVLGAVFLLYTRPEFWVLMANQVWACF